MNALQVLERAREKGVWVYIYPMPEGEAALVDIPVVAGGDPENPQSIAAGQKFREFLAGLNPQAYGSIVTELLVREGRGWYDEELPDWALQLRKNAELFDAPEETPVEDKKGTQELTFTGTVPFYEKPEQKAQRRAVEVKNLLARATKNADTLADECTIEWAEDFRFGCFIYRKTGRRSPHWFEPRESHGGDVRCDCEQARINWRVPCKHEIARERAMKDAAERAERDARIKSREAVQP